MNRIELFNFCRTSIDKDTLIFDEILNIYDIIMIFLNEHNLELKFEDNKIFLIKLVQFIYNHSSIK